MAPMRNYFRIWPLGSIPTRMESKLYRWAPRIFFTKWLHRFDVMWFGVGPASAPTCTISASSSLAPNSAVRLQLDESLISLNGHFIKQKNYPFIREWRERAALWTTRECGQWQFTREMVKFIKARKMTVLQLQVSSFSKYTYEPKVEK
jgi:hypothetical protein